MQFVINDEHNGYILVRSLYNGILPVSLLISNFIAHTLMILSHIPVLLDLLVFQINASDFDFPYFLQLLLNVGHNRYISVRSTRSGGLPVLDVINSFIAEAKNISSVKQSLGSHTQSSISSLSLCVKVLPTSQSTVSFSSFLFADVLCGCAIYFLCFRSSPARFDTPNISHQRLKRYISVRQLLALKASRISPIRSSTCVHHSHP